MTKTRVEERVWHSGKYSIYKVADRDLHALYKDGEDIFDGTFEEVYAMCCRLRQVDIGSATKKTTIRT